MQLYQYDNDGFLIGPYPERDIIPCDCFRECPPKITLDGEDIPQWYKYRRTGSGRFELVQDHRGREGYLNGESYTVKKWGPLPEGWSESAFPSNLEEAKNKARADLKIYRQQIEYGGFMLDGKKWDSEQKDELRLNSAFKMFEAGLKEYSGWKISEGKYIILTPEILQGASLALMQHYSHVFSIEASKSAEIEALNTPDAVEEWLRHDLKQGWTADEI